MSLVAFLAFKVRQRVILREDYIQIRTFRILFCFISNKKYYYINLNNFQVDIKQKGTKNNDNEVNIKCYDINGKDITLFDHNFELEEAEYFVYVANSFINQKKNMMPMF